jgi:hypothetical protein
VSKHFQLKYKLTFIKAVHPQFILSWYNTFPSEMRSWNYTVLWYVTMYSAVDIYWHFRTTCCPQTPEHSNHLVTSVNLKSYTNLLQLVPTFTTASMSCKLLSCCSKCWEVYSNKLQALLLSAEFRHPVEVAKAYFNHHLHHLHSVFFII